MSQQCPSCHASVSDSQSFCTNCGSSISRSPRPGSNRDDESLDLLPRDASDVLTEVIGWMTRSPILVGAVIATNLLGAIAVQYTDSLGLVGAAFLLQGVLSVLLLGAIPVYVRGLASGTLDGDGKEEFIGSMKTASSRFLPLLGILLLYGIIAITVVVIMYVLILSTLLGGTLDINSLVSAVLLVLVLGVTAMIAIVYLFARLSLAAAACVLNNRSFVESVRLSWQISRENTPKLSLFVMLAGVPSLILSGIPLSVGSAVVFVISEMAFARFYLAQRPSELRDTQADVGDRW